MSMHALRLIRHGKLTNDRWQLSDNVGYSIPADTPNWIVTQETYQVNRDLFTTRNHPIAIHIPSDTSVSELLALNIKKGGIQNVAMIVIDFPVYTDGRGYSLAQILRMQLGWTGELRAVGDVMIDTVHYLARCGFDSFLVKEGHDPEAALAAFNTFTVHYQKSYKALGNP